MLHLKCKRDWMLRDEIINEFAMSRSVGTFREFAFRHQVLWACLESLFIIQKYSISLKNICLLVCFIYTRVTDEY